MRQPINSGVSALPKGDAVPLEASPQVEDAGDARLVEEARAGEERAFAALVYRYENKLIRVIGRFVHDEELARDLAQETFWKVYNRLDSFDTARRFGPWLFRVGVNLALDHLRRHDPLAVASIHARNGDCSPAHDVPDPDPRHQVELAQEVRFLIEKIPVAYRTILVLRDLEGFSSAEVAAIVNRREATVRWRLSKARDQFRELWQKRESEEGEVRHV